MQRHVRGLDGIRAISALLVATMHMGLQDFGWIGVQFFYVLSGFLITKILVDSRKRTRGFSEYIFSFYRRRSLRIFPLYFLYIVVAFGFTFLGPLFLVDRHAMPYLATYTYNIYRSVSPLPKSGIVFHLWSLSVEEQFYIFWPVLLFAVPHRWIRKTVIAVIILAPVLRLLTYLLLHHHYNPSRIAMIEYFLTPLQMDGFALGGLLAVMADPEIAAWRSRIWSLVLISVAAMTFVNYHQTLFGLSWPSMAHGSAVWIYPIINLVGFVFVMECVLDGIVSGLLDINPIRYLGKISYGFYVWHPLSLNVASRILSKFIPTSGGRYLLLNFLLFLGINTALASASYFLYERRFLLKGRKAPLETIPLAAPIGTLN